MEGKDADHRSDIFSFGAVVYEMVTGGSAFDGGSPASVMAAILEREPPAMSTLQQLTPPIFDHIVRRCLAKQPDDRWQSAGDVMRELQWMAETSQVSLTTSGAPVDSRSTSARVLARALSWPVVAAVLAAALLAVLVLWSPWRPAAAPSLVRFRINAPRITGAIWAGAALQRRLVLSPDGTRIVYEQPRDLLMLQRLDQLEAVPVRGTATATAPFFSSDGKWIGYYDSRSRELRKVAVEGGSPATICKTPRPVAGASWADDDTIVFAAGGASSRFEAGAGLMRVSANGGEPELLTKPDASTGEVSHQFPSVLPGSRAVVFTITTETGDGARIAVLDRRSGKWRVLAEGRGAEYVGTGHLLYVAGSTLHAAPFALDRLEITGATVPVVEDVAVAGVGLGAAQYAVSRTGTLVYVPASAARGRPSSLVWVDRGGAEASVAGAPERTYRSLRLSPNDDRVALDVREGQYDTWVFDFRRRTFDKVTASRPGSAGQTGPADRRGPRNDFPVWTPDGQKIVTGTGPGLFWRPADGSGADEVLTTSNTEVQLPMSFTPDGKRLVLTEVKPGHDDLSVLSLDGAREVKPLTGLNTPGMDGPADLSPDGRWLAYQSNESGEPQIYVRPFPDVTRARYTISSKGGVHPAWSRSGGRELFYIDLEARMLTAVPVEAEGAELRFGAGVPLFNVSRYLAALHARSYDVSRDGKRFLFLREQTQSNSPDLTVVINWIEELKARMRRN